MIQKLDSVKECFGAFRFVKVKAHFNLLRIVFFGCKLRQSVSWKTTEAVGFAVFFEMNAYKLALNENFAYTVCITGSVMLFPVLHGDDSFRYNVKSRFLFCFLYGVFRCGNVYVTPTARK